MDKKEYKKALTDMRNNYIDYKKELDVEMTAIIGASFLAQKLYLDYVTMNLISSDNIIGNFIGKVIAYRIFERRTNRDLLDICTKFCEKYDRAKKELNRSDLELNKICTAIDFLNSVSEKELEKYMSYKIN